ncbi:DEAD/DEAH box helicase:Helicase C-terminal domain [Prochlorococcus marinus str. MIT 9515]|uniref:DEAD/DEAH box helicase:Helicase C-terminal domain n=1 Tax=Prochlorococcus marinus (strain MIT 9515) TaxID=167542 RepID=A2BWA6_PROM5|nr:ligase-associated DNA damage response DEXH box helicase [Prochlorococcus marinus]ABM72067.1 DEAD/DEAH box helicase:Helicase C-terminal domain [Prochlorococcus marinus str. MIT 9515]
MERFSNKSSINYIRKFFNKNGWDPLPYQIESWEAYLNGENGIIQVPTGCGKTYAALMGPLLMLQASPEKSGLSILVITPLKALSRDLKNNIYLAAQFFNKDLTVGIRNGDTSAYEKKKQILKPPNILITTPESLSLLLSNKEANKIFNNLISIIIDEWHELMGSKRGNQCELSLSWLRGNKKDLQIWAMSATIGNIKEAARAIVGIKGEMPRIISTSIKKEIEIFSVLPEEETTYPWSGHLGIKSYSLLLKVLDKNKSTLLFTNTRNQSERWYQCLRYCLPEMQDRISLHHGSLDKDQRLIVEDGVKNGSIKWVVCTSSLDLGVDFQPVDQIVQIGSAKNLARLIQRAGRSAHRPGGKSKIIFMPTNSLELLEISAMRRIIKSGISENIKLPELSFDVLLQHLVSLACGPGFNPNIEKERIKGCWSYRNLDDKEWEWCIDFLEYGGKCLKAYPKYKKIEREQLKDDENNFKYFVKDKSLIRMHKFNIGTITSDKFINVKYLKGKSLGNIEENFATKLKQGDTFYFAGKILQFVKIRDMTLYVKKSSKKSSLIPSWVGGQIAISDLLSDNLRSEIDICTTLGNDGRYFNKELKSLLPILKKQNKLSDIPKRNQLLIEIYKTKELTSLFVFTLDGKFVNEGIAFLWALRIAKKKESTFSISSNDFGFSLTTSADYDFSIIDKEFSYLIENKNLEKDLENAINFSELTKRRFKNIAQISGLVNQNNPTKPKSSSQLQISSSLLYDVFTRYEEDHLLIKQSHQEVKEYQLENRRIKNALERISNLKIILNETKTPSPFAFPLLVERLKNTLSNESIEKRVEKLIQKYKS